MITRRRFLQSSALVSLSPTIPTFLANTLSAAEAKQDDRILVVIQLDGGNDGINTLVPLKDEGYAANRKVLRLPAKDLIKLTDDVGFHPRLRSASELFHDGRLAVVQGVGYPNPNRSHFRSMAIWHSASFDEQDHDGPGWLGQAISAKKQQTLGPDVIHVGVEALPVALRGRRCVATSIANSADMELTLSELGGHPVVAGSGDNVSDFVSRSVLQAYASANELSRSAPAQGDAPRYPGSQLSRRLKLIGQMIKSGGAARVYYTSQGGYDTHAVQLPTHADLLGELSSSLKAFLNDMQAAGLEERMLVMAFSEFGRRVAENGSLGTDHGTAGPVFLAGGAVKPGLIGDTPSLTNLVGGDLQHGIDFRSIYTTVLDNWLQIPPPAHLQEFERLSLFGSLT